MAKALTMPTAPEAPIAPQISIGDRIHGIEDRIEEIESISGMSNSKSRDKSTRQPAQKSQQEESQEDQEEEQSQNQAQTRQQTRPQQTQPAPQTQQRQTSPTPETMARDAVANGSGALTKRTTSRKSDDNDSKANDSTTPSKNQSTVVIPPNTSAILNDNGQTKFERGRAVLNEFKQLDQEEGATSKSADNTTSSTSTPGIFAPSYGSNSSGHGAVYWLFTVVAVVIMAFVFIRQFLVNKDSKTPPLTKSTLDIPDINEPIGASIPKEAAVKQYKQSSVQTKNPAPTPKPKPIVKTITKPKPLKLESKNNIKTEDDNKGTRFEVRV